MSIYRYDNDDDSSDDSSTDDDSSTTSSYSDGYGNDPDWMEKFNLGKCGDRPSTIETKSLKKPNAQILKSTDWMKKFEMVKKSQSSTSSNSQLHSDEKKPNDVGYGSKTNCPKPSSHSELKQDTNVVRGSAEKANETSKYARTSFSHPVDKAERRKRIRRNLEKLRQRQIETNNLSSSGGWRKQKRQPQRQRRQTYPSTRNTRMIEDRKTVATEIEKLESRREPFENINCSTLQISPIASNNCVDPPEKTRNKNRSDTTKQIDIYAEGNATSSLSNELYTEETHKAAYRQNNINNTGGELNDKEVSNRVTNIMQPVLSSSRDDEIEWPSIDTKLDSLRKAIDRKNMIKNTSNQGNDRKTNSIKPHLSLAENKHAKSPSSPGKIIVPQVLNQNTDSFSNNDMPKNDTKFHSSKVEIETSVPKNLFGMWGETVKSKKPTVDASMMSNRMIRNQADRIKQRIEKAKKEAMHSGGNRDVDVNNITEEYSGGIKLDPDESASALFFGAASQKPDDKTLISMENYVDISVAVGSIDSDVSSKTKQRSDGVTSTIEDAAALFYNAGSANITENKTNRLVGNNLNRINDSVRNDESTDEEDSTSEDSAALFYNAGAANNAENKTNKLGVDDSNHINDSVRNDESTDGETSTSEDSVALFYNAGSANNTEHETKGLSEDDSNHVNEYVKNGESSDGETSTSEDAAALFYNAGSANNTEHETKGLSEDDSSYINKYIKNDESSDGETSTNEDAAALFNAGSANNTEHETKGLSEDDSSYICVIDTSEESTDGEDSASEDTAALFYDAGYANNLELEKKDLSEDDSSYICIIETKEESSNGENSTNEDAAALGRKNDKRLSSKPSKTASLVQNTITIDSINDIKSWKFSGSEQKEKELSKMTTKKKARKKNRSKNKDIKDKIKNMDKNQHKKNKKSKAKHSKKKNSKSKRNGYSKEVN